MAIPTALRVFDPDSVGDFHWESIANFLKNRNKFIRLEPVASEDSMYSKGSLCYAVPEKLVLFEGPA